MVNKKDTFSALSMKDRAELLNIYVKGGMMDLKEIKAHYNSLYEEKEPNKYGWGGASKEALGKAFGDASSTAGSVSNIASSVMTMVSNGMENAEINTTEADNAIEAVESYKLDNSSLDALANSYNSTPWAATDYDSSDFTKSGWEIAGNTFESTLSGITTGASVGGPWGAVIGGLAGLGSGLIGWGIGEAKAEEAERRLEEQARKANRAIELNAVNTRDSILQQQTNNTLRNIAADGGRLLKGDEDEQTLSGNNIDTSKPLESRENYLNKQRQSIIDASLERSRTRVKSTIPWILEYENELAWRREKEFQLEKNEQYLDRAIKFNHDKDIVKELQLEIEALNNELSNGYEEKLIPGAACIYTATDNYGKEYRVASNQEMYRNPEKYGFKRINPEKALPGDILQIDLTHAVTFDHLNEDGQVVFNQSKGGREDVEVGRVAASNGFSGFSNAYRFVGRDSDNKKWNNEYNQYRKDYSSKVLEELKDVPQLPTDEARMLDGNETEQTTTGLPVGAGLATYNHPKYNHAEEAEMYSYLRSRGVPHVQASAIMGNIAVESMLNPEITQIGGGGGYGLIQATDRSRKKAFINYDGQPYEFGSNISPETQRQLDYIIDKGLNTQTRGEWRGNHNIGKASVARRKFLEATDVNKASTIFTENYLRPGKPNTKRRKSMSNYFYDNYGITERALKEFENSFLFQNN